MRTKLLRLFRKREEIPAALKCPTCKGKGKTAHGSIDGWVVLLCRDCKGTGRRAESYNAGKKSASVSWLDVLRERVKCDHAEAIAKHKDGERGETFIRVSWLNEVSAAVEVVGKYVHELKSASIGADERPAPASRSENEGA